jgi:hypothetical protein
MPTQLADGTLSKKAKKGQLQRLSPGEIRRLKAGGTDPHSLKPSGGLEDLFKDKNGNIYVGNKDGTGEWRRPA